MTRWRRMMSAGARHLAGSGSRPTRLRRRYGTNLALTELYGRLRPRQLSVLALQIHGPVNCYGRLRARRRIAETPTADVKGSMLPND